MATGMICRLEDFSLIPFAYPTLGLLSSCNSWSFHVCLMMLVFTNVSALYTTPHGLQALPWGVHRSAPNPLPCAARDCPTGACLFTRELGKGHCRASTAPFVTRCCRVLSRNAMLISTRVADDICPCHRCDFRGICNTCIHSTDRPFLLGKGRLTAAIAGHRVGATHAELQPHCRTPPSR